MRKLFYALCLVAACNLNAVAKEVSVVKDSLKSEAYITRYGNLDNVAYQIKNKKNANIVFFGGSITNMVGWRDKVCKYLSDTYPDTHFNFINAGIPSLGSLPHAFRMEKDVLSKGRVDLLFVESAVNDRGNGTNETTQRRALEGIVRHMLKVNPYTNIVMMAFVDEDKMADYNANKIPAEVQVHQDIAEMYHLPFINLAKEVTDRINAGEFNWKDDFKSLHPSPFGQDIYFRTIKQLLSVGLGKGGRQKPVATHLLKPADEFNYEHGEYLDISKAIIKQGFVLDTAWRPTDGVHTRPGFVHVPMLVADKPSASLELPFTGRTIGIGVIAGPDAGIINYSIDGKDYPAIDLYTRWSKTLHLPWYLILGDGLSPNKHLLKIQVSDQHNDQSKGTACRIVYFLLNK
ncbi:SGNH/GDSL hydrolase family protein [Mucilaginibacter sp. L196]|uniref:SGNH/GDSL hydrolase family protein n=1 Tax=Mucilaginibacter sp. L196 TaxID=1641870 RepID=UPI00131B2CAA|nr:SGNH/GDSL hydrolase family protein [Mucilaginibacter sp. L196]